MVSKVAEEAYALKRQALTMRRQAQAAVRLANEILGLPADDDVEIGLLPASPPEANLSLALRDATSALDRCFVVSEGVMRRANELAQSDRG